MERKPLEIPDQIAALRLYMRTLTAAMNRAYREGGVDFRKRRTCPFVEQLRYRRSSAAFQLYEIGVECIAHLRHAQALAMAEFAPGEQITYEVVMKGFERSPERAVIVDAEWSRPNWYHYAIWHVTKQGQLFKRGETWLSVTDRVRITRCDLPLTEETRRYCENFKRAAEEFSHNARDRGSLDRIVEAVEERRARRGY